MSKFPILLIFVFLKCGNALEMPKWSDIFSSLQPYKDPSEDGEPRLGFVQVSKIFFCAIFTPKKSKK